MPCWEALTTNTSDRSSSAPQKARRRARWRRSTKSWLPGVDVGQLLVQIVGYLRDCLVTSVGAGDDQLLHVSTAEKPRAMELARQMGAPKIMAAMQVLDQALARLRFSTQERTLCELALVRICHLNELDEVSAAIAELREAAPVAGASRSSVPNPTTNQTRSPSSTRGGPAARRDTAANASQGDAARSDAGPQSTGGGDTAVAAPQRVDEQDHETNGSAFAEPSVESCPLTPETAPGFGSRRWKV